MRSALVPAKDDDTKSSSAFAQHFIDTLHRKLHDPSLLQAYPQPPPPEVFKHNDKNAASAGPGFLEEAASLSNFWGSERHPFSAPPGSYKLLSSDYAWLDAPRAPARREASAAAAGGGEASKAPGGGQPAEQRSDLIPEPPVAMQQARFLSHARLVLIKLRQQLEEICVGAVRTMEDAAMPGALGGADALTHGALSTMASFGGSTVATGAYLLGGAGGGGLGGVARSLAAATSFADFSVAGPGSVVSGMVGGGGGRLPPGLADELAASVKSKLAAAFEDCLSDLMDQLWNALQYAGSKHALVDRMAEAMKQREAELEATAAKYREEAASKLRSLRRQKEEIEAAAEKDRAEQRALAAAANTRADFLEREMAALRTAVENERSQINARLDAQRAEYEAALQAREEAAEAARADSVLRLEELRVANATLSQQLQQRQDELAKMTARATEQSDILGLALARRDGTSKELEGLTAQLDDFKRFVQVFAHQPLPEWLQSLREGDTPLVPLVGGPLTLEYGTGRAFMAAARSEGLRAVQEELRRVLPAELPWPEEGWPPAVDEEGAGGAAANRSPSPELAGRNGSFPPTLPAAWFRFARAPLGHVMEAPQLMSHLADLARAKWEADREARLQGLPPPDLHMFVYKHALSEHSSALDADEAVTCLVQSLRAHAPRLPRAATWMQLLQLSSPALPLDACSYYLEVFHALIASPSSSSSSSSSTSRIPHNVVDRAACLVWVAPPRWKAVLTGPASAVFDSERKMALLKQAAAVRVDTTRGSKTFGMTEGDALMAVLMGVWLSQRQAAISDLQSAWSAVEPVGGGVLAVNMDVDQLAGVAVSALGRESLPRDRPSLLDLYFSTVQAARQAQAAARMRWSGLNVAALASALASAELLPPRPLSRRGNPSAARLAAAASHLLRIADFVQEDMRAHPGFRAQHPSFNALETALGRVRDLVVLCGAQDASVREQAEQERRVQAGWAALEGATGAMLEAMEAYRGYEAGVREQVVKAAVDAALGRTAGEGGEGRRTTPRAASMRHRSSSRIQRTSTLGATYDPDASPGTSTADPANPATATLSPAQSTPTSHRLSGPDSASGTAAGAALASISSRLAARFNAVSPRPGSGRRSGASGRPHSAAWPRDLRAALASGHWSSDEDEEALSVDDIVTPPTLQLRGRSARRTQPHHAATTPGELGAAEGGGGGGDSARGSDVGGGGGGSSGKDARSDDEGLDPAFDPNSPPEVRLAALEGKYLKLRSRFGQTRRALSAAYSNASAAGETGAGLPAPEVMAQLGPAAKLRLVAELLAELHQEVEQGVWPHLDHTVRAAITGQAAGGPLPPPLTSPLAASAHGPGSGSRRVLSALPSSGMLSPSLTVRPLSAFASPRRGGTHTGVASEGRPASALTMTGSRMAGEFSTLSSSWVASAMGGSTGPGELLFPPDVAGGSSAAGAASSVTAAAGPDGLRSPPVPLAEVHEVAGRLHAHAGHVGQVMAAAALETAALAAALDDLSSWRPSSSRSVRQGGRSSQGMTPPPSGEAAGVGRGFSGADGFWAGMGPGASASWRSWTPNSTTGGAAGDAPQTPLSPAPPSGGVQATPLRRSPTTPRSSGLVPPLPLAALQYGMGGGGYYSTTLSASGASSSPGGSYSGAAAAATWEPAAAASDSSGGGADPAATAAAADVAPANPWDEGPVEGDPRDTAYLDALRALHLAAEAQGAGEGGVEPLMAAVREVVRLMGGQPQVAGDGQVIEFFPRRIPKDWRHPVLRSSLTRLYIYVAGALVQQHERDRLLAEAAADVDERLARLSAAADDLEGKAAGLRGLQTALAAQMAAMAAWVAHGSVLMDKVGRLEALGGDLKARVVDALPSEQVSLLQLAAPQAPPPAAAAAAAAKGLPGMPPRPAAAGKGRMGPSRLSNGSEAAGAAPAPALAGTPMAAAAASAPVATAGGSLPPPPVQLGPGPPPHAAPPLSRGPEAALLALGPPAPGGAAPGGVRGPSTSPRPAASKVAVFPVEDWEAVQATAADLVAAVAGLREAAAQLAIVAQFGVRAGGLSEGRGAAGASFGQPPLPALKLPSGDRILSVHVSLPASTSVTGKRGTATNTGQPQVSGNGEQGPPGAPQGQGLGQQQQPQPPQPLAFSIDFDPPAATSGVAATDTLSDAGAGPVDQDGLVPLPGAAAGGGGLPQYPDVGTPAVTPEASCALLPRTAGGPASGFAVHMAVRQAYAHAGPSASAGVSDDSDGNLPPGEALIQLSDTLLRRSAMAAMRRHLGSTGGAGRPAGRFGSTAAVDGLGAVPAHYERRPMTARAFVEGVMMQAREEQLGRLYGAGGCMPRGGLPEVDGMQRLDGHDAALLEQRALVLAGPEPHPTTALDVLVQQNMEQAAAASVAATTAVVEAVSAAAAAASGPGAASGRSRSPGRGAGSGRQSGGVGAPTAVGTPRQAGGGGSTGRPSGRDAARGVVVQHSRLATGVAGTKISTLPPMAPAAASVPEGEAARLPGAPHLGYYPGVQVDAGGRVRDWRLPVLASQPGPTSLQVGAATTGKAVFPQPQLLT